MIRYIFFSFCLPVLLVACSSTVETADVAAYTGDPEHGLFKLDSSSPTTLSCQLIPQSGNKESNEQPILFRLLMKNSGTEQVTDSAFYDLNYHSSDFFNLIVNSDTLTPAISERVANGRKDIHEFTVLFSDVKLAKGDKLQFRIAPNALLNTPKTFVFQKNDITKAIKTLYAYEVRN